MIEFLLKIILHRGMALPLFWGSVHPLLNGDVLIRDLRLGQPALVTVETTTANLDWESLFFGAALKVSSAELKNVESSLSLADPLRLIRCLRESGSECVAEPHCRLKNPRVSSEEPRTIKQEPPKAGNQKAQLPPLNFIVGKFSIASGTIELCRRGEQIELLIESASGENVVLPLADQDFSVTFQLLARTHGKDQKSYPVHAALHWDGLRSRLDIDASVVDFPIYLLTRLFPEISDGRDTHLAIQVGSQTIIQDVRQSATVTGDIQFRYEPEKDRWRVNLPPN